MSVALGIQSAPVPTARPGEPSAWSGTSATVVTPGGIYTGRAAKTITFTAQDSGTVDTHSSIEITWADGEGQTGRLQVGSTWYSSGTFIPVLEGVTVAFSADTVVATETFTIAVVPKRGHLDYHGVTADADPADVILTAGSSNSLDSTFADESGTVRRTRVAIHRNPTLLVDYQNDATRRATDYMEAARREVTVAENYDSSTILLWRPCRGIMPVVGSLPTFARSGVGSYLDADSGLLRVAADGVPRHEAAPVGRGMVFSGPATNLLGRSNATSSTAGWQTSAGTAVVAFDAGVSGVLDPSDELWNDGYRRGTQRLELPAASDAARTALTATVSGSVGHVWSLYVKGRGQVIIAAMSGPAATNPPTNTVSFEIVTLTEDWQRVVLQGVTGGTLADVLITAVERSVCWVSSVQIEAGLTATAYIETVGASTGTRNAESLTFNAPIPSAGTLSMWVWLPPGNPTGDYNLWTTTSGSNFSLQYDATAGNVEFFTSAASQLVGSGALAQESWNHVAVTWERSATAGSADRVIYLNGVADASDTSTAHVLSYGNSSEVNASGGTDMKGWRFAEIRLDARAWSADEAQEQYDRMTSAEWLHMVSQYYGRRYWIEGASYQWLSISNPGILLATLPLSQSGVENDALAVPL